MGFAGTLKDVINTLTDPRIFITVVAIGFLLALRTRGLWRARPALIMGLLAVAFVGVSMLDPNFALIVKKPDNVPIVAMLFLVGFFLWLSLSQAYENDDRIAAGQPPREAADGEAEKTWVWPDLVYTELLAMVIGMIILVVWSLLLKAPIEEPANPARTPNPSKAPWYFLGLQEMLVYFDPWLAGVVFPSLIIVGLMAIPYIDVNPKGNGYFTFKERRTEITIFLFGFLILWVTLVMLGTFLRGPNWNFFGPYEYWDIHKLLALNNVNLSEYFWVKILHTKLPSGPVGMWVRELPGILIVLFYIGVLPGILAMTRKTWTLKLGKRELHLTFGLRKYFEKLGPWRYSVFVMLLLCMIALPIKMVLRWTINLKYIIAMPEIFFNI
jgi:cytochrome b/b6/petD-like protein